MIVLVNYKWSDLASNTQAIVWDWIHITELDQGNETNFAFAAYVAEHNANRPKRDSGKHNKFKNHMPYAILEKKLVERYQNNTTLKWLPNV